MSARAQSQAKVVKARREALYKTGMHPQTRLCYEILPYVRELDGHEWTVEERDFLSGMERLEGRPLAEWEKRMAVAQARMIGHL